MGSEMCIRDRVNGKHVTNFLASEYAGGTGGTVIGGLSNDDAANQSFHGNIASIEVYADRKQKVPASAKVAIMTSLSREYGISLDTDYRV